MRGLPQPRPCRTAGCTPKFDASLECRNPFRRGSSSPDSLT